MLFELIAGAAVGLVLSWTLVRMGIAIGRANVRSAVESCAKDLEALVKRAYLDGFADGDAYASQATVRNNLSRLTVMGRN